MIVHSFFRQEFPLFIPIFLSVLRHFPFTCGKFKTKTATDEQHVPKKELTIYMKICNESKHLNTRATS